MHHALLFRTVEELPELAQSGGPDTYICDESVLGIDAVRVIQRHAYQKAVEANGVRTVVVKANRIRSEAQNALLKLLEEPPAGARFYFVIGDQSSLLPTLLSRFAKVTQSHQYTSTEVADNFVSLAKKDRLELVATKTAAKDLSWQKGLLDGLESLCAKRKIPAAFSDELLFVRQEIVAPGASAKMLLEHLSLAVDELKA